MPQDERLDPSLRALAQIMAALVVCAATWGGAMKLLQHPPESALLRALIATIGVLGCGGLALVIAKAIRAEIEFNRRIHLVALALAFGATALFIVAADMLQRAGFVRYVSLPVVLLVMVVTWWLAIQVAARYYR